MATTTTAEHSALRDCKYQKKVPVLTHRKARVAACQDFSALPCNRGRIASELASVTHDQSLVAAGALSLTPFQTRQLNTDQRALTHLQNFISDARSSSSITRVTGAKSPASTNHSREDVIFHGVTIKVPLNLIMEFQAKLNNPHGVLHYYGAAYFYFSANQPVTRDAVNAAVYLMHEAMLQGSHAPNSNWIKPGKCCVIDVMREETILGPSSVSRLSNNIQLKCRDIASIWPTI